MTIAVDTNILVRYLTWDDLAQAQAATRIIESGETIAISTIVLCELVWVLRRLYRQTAADIADAVQDIITSRDVLTDRPAAEAGLQMLRAGADFADGVIKADADKARCRHIVTFDRAFAASLGDAAVVPR
jgi:predicted nucleic-acid-binding protein